MADRVFRLPVVAACEPELEAAPFQILERRFFHDDNAFYFYLKAPHEAGTYMVGARCGGQEARVEIGVRTLEQLRRPHEFNGAQWPRRWPLGRDYCSVKSRQTLQDMPLDGVDEKALEWWRAQEDARLWRQLPPAEMPRAHFVNVHQGCPSCGTSIFTHGGFYPWKRVHRPADFRSTCPSCAAIYPSNDLAQGDFTGGDAIDDGYGYFDAAGHIYLFAATYARDQVRAFGAAIGQMTHALRTDFNEQLARQLGLMLLRYAVEENYLAAVPQFRYGPSNAVEQPWDGGQPDWAAKSNPLAALYRMGSMRYCIDVPYISETLALAYDTVWPLLREDEDVVKRASACGLELESPAGVVGFIEEMLAAQLYNALDGGASSNLPRVSQGVLVLLRGLERADAGDVMAWLYDAGPDRMRVFGINNFFPDGTPPESTGGYNNIHSNGLFALEYHLRQLRRLHPQAYAENEFPSLVADPRAAKVALAPYDIAMLGKAYFQFGDGGAANQPGRYSAGAYHRPLRSETLAWAAAFTGAPEVEALRQAVEGELARCLGPTVHDGVGLALLRTGDTLERAAAGIFYGDTTGHRHMDLLDVQLFAFDRPFLTDLGYPQSWATREAWEGHWATHNTVWGVIPELEGRLFSGRGRLVRHLFVEGVQIFDIEAERWALDGTRWYKPGVSFRRLVALVKTDGEGVCLVDLSRIKGGSEHWRTCRGLEGEFVGDELREEKRAGTVAGADRARGELADLSHHDYAALAYMDDVAVIESEGAWKGRWVFRHEEGVYLDLHQLRANPTAQALRARATAAMGTPEESTYLFNALLWHNKPESAEDTTYIDLVFEPRVGAATVAQVRSIAANDTTAVGVEIQTVAKRRIAIYWAPQAQEEICFDNGVVLRSGLVLDVDGEVRAVGASAVRLGERQWDFPEAVQTGTIVGLDRKNCTVDLEDIEGIVAGDRIRVNPEGRGHNYQVLAVEPLTNGCRLTLDVTTLLGIGKVTGVDGVRVELDGHIMARTGNLHGTRLVAGDDGAEIIEAHNPNTNSTVVELARPFIGLAVGAWIEVVDGVVGDPVVFELVQVI